ncbi:MAG: hypothetical protein ACHQ4F_06650 [Candidatus Dormibacteria bacterium]
MAEVFILEFEGFGADAYDRVNKVLGINMDSGDGDWPAGLHTHLAGPTEGGGWIVVEVWESQEDQDEFMKTRLGPALQEAGVTGAPKRAEWTKPRAHHTPKKPSKKSG